MTTEARLRAFAAVAETGSVRAAAQRLVVTESAVSAAVAALTRDVGTPLLERQGRGLRLTSAGRTYAGYARTILGLHEEALAAARGDAYGGPMRLAAVTTAGEHVLPAVLASFRDRHPGVELRLEVGTREHVWGLLAAHEADLVIAGRAPASLPVTVRAVRPNALVVVGAPEVAADFGLGRTTWLMREAGSGTRETCEALLAALDAEPPTLTLGSNGAVVAGAAAGLGVTLVSRDAVRALLASGQVTEVPVPQTPMRRPWHAVTYPRAPAAAEVLVAHLLTQDSPVRWRRPPRAA
jgi:LysR family transcriptional regulator, low CO2-responsive transcriptional regulator